jgi:hypothetical protein
MEHSNYDDDDDLGTAKLEEGFSEEEWEGSDEDEGTGDR